MSNWRRRVTELYLKRTGQWDHDAARLASCPTLFAPKVVFSVVWASAPCPCLGALAESSWFSSSCQAMSVCHLKVEGVTQPSIIPRDGYITSQVTMDFVGACFISVRLGTSLSHHRRLFADDCKFAEIGSHFIYCADVFETRFVHLWVIFGDQLFHDVFYDELMYVQAVLMSYILWNLFCTLGHPSNQFVRIEALEGMSDCTILQLTHPCGALIQLPLHRRHGR